MERDELVKLSTVESILDKQAFEDIYYNQHFVCSLLMNNFKQFLSDENFDKLERQLALYKFLINNYPLELSRDVVEYVNQCDLAQDYQKIIMEWNYGCSDFIKQYAVFKYDASQLAFDKSTLNAYNYHQETMNKGADIITNIMKLLTSETKNEEE